MKYTEEQIIGELGELAVARAFIKYFRWPCRRQTIDLGVDAEVEITDDDLNATGKVVKVQVKATLSPFVDGKNVVYLEARHIDYWKDFSVPVLLCAVSVATDEMLWKVIASDRDYSTGKGGAKIEFDRVADALSPASRHAIERIAVEGGDMIMQILGIAEASIVPMLGNTGTPAISLEDNAQVQRHALNGRLLSIVHELLQLAGRPRPATTARLAWLQGAFSAINQALDRENKAHLY